MARRPLVLKKQFKTLRHRCPLDISIFDHSHATLPRQIPVQREIANRPDDSTTNQPCGDDSNNNETTTVTMGRPVPGFNFGLGQGLPELKRRRRIPVECPGLFKLPSRRPDYALRYDKSKPWKATEGTVVVTGPLPGNLNRPSPCATFNQTMSQTTTTATIGQSVASSDETGTGGQQSASTGTFQHGTFQPYGYPFTSTHRQELSASDTESPCSKAPNRVVRPPPHHAYHTSVMETPLSHSESPLGASVGQGHSTAQPVTSLKQVPGHLPPFPARKQPPMVTRMAPSVKGTAGTTQAPHPGKTQQQQPKASRKSEVVDPRLDWPTVKIGQKFKFHNIDRQVASGQHLAPVLEVSEVPSDPPFMIHFPPLHLLQD